MDGISLEFEKEAVEAIAQKAIDLKTGARGLRSIIEGCMLGVMYSAPSDPLIEKIKIIKSCIDGNLPPEIEYKSIA